MSIKITFILCLGILGFSLFQSANVFASSPYIGDIINLPPTDDYQTFKTDHFEVIYPQSLTHLSDDTASYLEEAHKILAPYYGYEPSRRTVVILTDNQDSANGITSAIGHQGIVLYVVSPEPYSSINDMDNWLRNLIIHEYTHYLTLHPTRGLFKVFTYLFGDLALPNSLWPTWLSEGIAVYAETAFSRMGRGSGPYYETLTRDGIARGTLGSQLLNFDKIMGPVPDFPFGEGLYFAGWAIVDQMTHDLGKDSQLNYSHASSGRIPYFLNSTLEGISLKNEHSFQGLWERWIERQRERLKPELEALEKTETPKLKLLTPAKLISMGGRISPDEKFVAYVHRSGHERMSLKLLNMESGQTETLDDAVANPGLSWSADGNTLYFSKLNFQGPYRFYGDLYQWSRENGVEKITSGARAKDPSLCAETDILVYTTMAGGQSHLMKFELTSKKSTTLYSAPSGYRIANPRCTSNANEGTLVYFSMHGLEPLESMHALPLQTGKVRHLFGGFSQGFGALFPEPTKEGLLFTRVSNGHYDLAIYNKNKIYTVAHSTAGYWFPQRSGTKLLVTYFSSEGFQAAEMPLSAIDKALSGPGTLVRESTERNVQDAVITKESFTKTDVHGYRLYESLLPRLWSPFLVLSTKRAQYGGYILGWDDTDQFQYTINGWYDTIKKGPNGYVNTFHRLGGFRLDLLASSDLTSYSAANGLRAYSEEYIMGTRLSRPFPRAFHVLEPFVTVQWARVHFDGDFGKTTFTPEIRYGAGLTYDSRQIFAHSIAPESGGLGKFEGKRFQPLNGTGRGAWKYWLSWNQLLPAWPQHSVLSFNGIYAATPKARGNLPISFVETGGRGRSGDLDPPLRGYPLGGIAGRRAYVLQSEYKIPIDQVFNGIGTFPFFMRNHGLSVFGDMAKVEFSNNTVSPLLGGVGFAYLFNFNLFYLVPVNMRLEFAQGLNTDYLGEKQFFIGFGS